MDNCIAGKLPEPLRAWAKFRPDDLLDFSRRAKNLAKFLKLPLQKTQDALACAYGYSGRHELHQVLDQPGSPGPYEECIPDELYAEVGEAKAIVQFYRDKKLLSAVSHLIESAPKRYFENSDTLVCDLELFAQPVRHRAAMKAIEEFMAGGTGCTNDGYPYGYRGTLHTRYFDVDNIEFDETALRELEAGWLSDNPGEDAIFDPRLQARALLRFRAPHLFIEMAEATAGGFIGESAENDLDFDAEMLGDYTDFSAWMLADVDFLVAHQLSNEEDSEDELERLLSALRCPRPEQIAASSVASAIPNFQANVPLWRLSLRYKWARELQHPDYDDWGEESEPTLILESFLHENGGHVWQDDNGTRWWLNACMQKQSLDINQVHWNVSATLFFAETFSSPWKATAVLTGTHIIAAEENSYDGPADMVNYFADVGDLRLLRAWEILDRLYIPVADYLSYHEWVNNLWDGGGVVSILAPWVAPAYRGTDVSRRLLEGFVSSFDENTGHCSDSMWRGWVDPRSDDVGMEAFDTDDTEIPAAGVLFIPLPGSGMLGYSLWDAERETSAAKLLRHKGERIGMRSRWGRSEPIKGGIGPRLLEVAIRLRTDVVLFDPNDAYDDSRGS